MPEIMAEPPPGPAGSETPPPTPLPSPSARRSRRGTGSRFQALVLVITAISISVTGLVVWYLGYRTAESISSGLTSQLYSMINSNIHMTMSTQLLSTARICDMLKHFILTSYPSFLNADSVEEQPNLWLHQNMMLSLSPQYVISLGCTNLKGASFGMGRDPAFVGGSHYRVFYRNSSETAELCTSSLRNSGDDQSTSWDDTELLHDLLMNQSITSLRHFNMLQAHHHFLYDPRERPFWAASLHANGKTVLGDIMPMYGKMDHTGWNLAVPLGKAILTKDPATGELHPAAMCNAFLSAGSLHDVMKDLPLKKSGRAYLIQQDGLLVSSSRIIKDLAEHRNSSIIDVHKSQDPFLAEISWLMRHVSATEIQSRGSDHPLLSEKFIQDSTFVFQASSIHVLKRAWILVIVTNTSDVIGNHFSNLRVTLLLSTLVIMTTLAFSNAVMDFVARPMSITVEFLRELGEIITHDRVDSTSSDDPEKDLRNISSYQALLARYPEISSLNTPTTAVARDASPRSCCQILCQALKAPKSLQKIDFRSADLISWLFTDAYQMQLTLARTLQALCTSIEVSGKANAARRHFIRYIFHELRVPFNSIYLGIHNLRADAGHIRNTLPDFVDTIELVDDQCSVISKILNDVLSLQKIEEGKFSMEKCPFRFCPLIIRTVQSYRNMLAEKRIEFSLKLQSLTAFSEGGEEFINPDDQGALYNHHTITTTTTTGSLDGDSEHSLPAVANTTGTVATSSAATWLAVSTDVAEVFGDEYRLRQVVANMLSNAIKFTPSGGRVWLECTLRQANSSERDKISAHPDDDVVLVRVSVKDTGPGVAPEHMQTLFTPYTQFSAGQLQKGQGTGLGLSISRRLVQLHGGTMGVSSTVGEGSEFYFEVPMAFRRIQDSPPTDSAISERKSTDSLTLSPPTAIAESTADTVQFGEQQGPTGLTVTGIGSSGPSSPSSHFSGDSPDSMGRKRRYRRRTRRRTERLMRTHNVPSSRTTSSNRILSATTALRDAEFPSPPSPSAPVTVPLPLLSPSRSVRIQAARTALSGGHPVTDPDTPTHELRFRDNPSPLMINSPSSSSRSALSDPPTPVGTLLGRILIVEDSAPNRKMLAKLLRSLHFEIAEAENGQIAVEFFHGCQHAFSLESTCSGGELPTAENRTAATKRFPFDLVIMDGMMPVMNGMQATRELRQMGVTIPIIAITGNALQEDQDAFLEAGANLILTKPVTKIKLVETFQKFLPSITVTISTAPTRATA